MGRHLRPQMSWGLGILDSRYFNVALMLKWVWRILRGDGGLWLQLVKTKYLRGRPLLACERREGSQFWRAIQDIKLFVGMGVFFSIGNGEGVRLWLDPWLHSVRLCEQFPALFAIS